LYRYKGEIASPYSYILYKVNRETFAILKALNKKYPNYDWDSEMIVVKQSLPVIVTGIIGMIVLITPIFLNWVLNIPITFVLQVVSVVLLVITMGVYITMSKSNFI